VFSLRQSPRSFVIIRVTRFIKKIFTAIDCTKTIEVFQFLLLQVTTCMMETWQKRGIKCIERFNLYVF